MRKNNIYTFLLTTIIGFSVFAQDMSKTKDSRLDPLEEILNGNADSKPQEKKEEVKKVPTTSELEAAEANAKVPKKIEELKKEPVKKKEQLKITKEESDLLKVKFKSLKDRPDLVEEIEKEKAEAKSIYSPAPQARDRSEDGLVVERDSSKVIFKKMSINDSLNVKMCFNAGVQIVLDDDISTTLQTALLDDKIFFDAQPFENNRGVYVRLKQPIPNGSYWESSVRLIRKSDDKSYLVNLFGLPCPTGPYPFPKVIYLKEKYSGLTQKNKILTPEDTIISLSQGLPRIKKNRIRVYDMVASSGSDWVVFGVEVQFPSRTSADFDKDLKKYWKLLDNLQVNEKKVDIEYLPIQSEKATQFRGIRTMRFKITANINKNYILNNRFLHLMYVDKEEGHYQYVRIDTLPYFLSLKKRGFEL